MMLHKLLAFLLPKLPLQKARQIIEWNCNKQNDCKAVNNI